MPRHKSTPEERVAEKKKRKFTEHYEKLDGVLGKEVLLSFECALDIYLCSYAIYELRDETHINGFHPSKIT